MLRFDRILLASDFSPNGEAALHYAATLARQCRAHLNILHVIDTRVNALPRWRDIFHATEVFTDREIHQNDALASLQGHPALTDLTVNWITTYGKPSERIIDLSLHADLVVIGSQGSAATLGKVAQQVAHGCPIPVLLVPNGISRAMPQPGAERLSLQRVLLALHVAHYAPRAICLSKALAKSNNAILEVLQVIDADQASTYAGDLGAGLHHNRQAVKILLQKRLAGLIPDEPAGIAIERSVIEGKAMDVILRQSKAQQADFIVMSAHPYGRLHKFFTVSTVDEVAAQAPCPVLTVPYPNQSLAAITVGKGGGNAA
jgi:nucleotide-binding universal stress UspA family protein